MPLRLADGLSRNEVAVLIDVDEAAVEHLLEGLLGLVAGLLLLLEFCILLDEAFQSFQFVLNGLLLREGLELLLLDLHLRPSALAANPTIERKTAVMIKDGATYFMRWAPVPLA